MSVTGVRMEMYKRRQEERCELTTVGALQRGVANHGAIAGDPQ